jgi:hypothetical protein
MSGITKTAGQWHPDEWPTYFVASSPTFHLPVPVMHKWILFAINEMAHGDKIKEVERHLDLGVNVFIDSGVFWLSTQHAKRNGITMDKALGMAPSEIDDFDWLYDAYVKILSRVGHRVWGYIEIDQGGRENKIKTRARLEAEGLRPIPVYHPFNDGWDYFDYLAERYDRICFGNVVQADIATRKRLIATAWERRKKYPHLWIHMLGLTPAERSLSYPLPSCDSSTWLSSVRFGAHTATVGTKRCWRTGEGMLYRLEADKFDKGGWAQAVDECHYSAEMLRRTMAAMAQEQKDVLGIDYTGASL